MLTVKKVSRKFLHVTTILLVQVRQSESSATRTNGRYKGEMGLDFLGPLGSARSSREFKGRRNNNCEGRLVSAPPRLHYAHILLFARNGVHYMASPCNALHGVLRAHVMYYMAHYVLM